MDSPPNPYEPSCETDPPDDRNIDATLVHLTRKRWDLYFIPVIILVSIFSIPIALLTDRLRLMLSPFGLLAVWLMVRQMTPTKGWNERTIRGTPGMTHMLIWLAFCAVLGVVLLYADWIILGHQFHAPLKPYHIAATVALVVTMIGGAMFLDHRYKFNSRNRDAEP